MLEKLRRVAFFVFVGGGLGTILGALAEDASPASMNLAKGDFLNLGAVIGALLGASWAWLRKGSRRGKPPLDQ